MTQSVTQNNIYKDLESFDRRIQALERSLVPEVIHFIGDVDEPAFTGTWINFAVGVEAYFYKDRGRVYLSGIIKSGTAGTSAFTLPDGYLPFKDVEDFVVLGGPSASPVFVAISGITGTVVPNNIGASNVNTFTELNGINFLAK